MSSQAVILIFHHSGHLKWYEEISLKQCFEILGHHPIRLVCPAGTNLDRFIRIIPNIRVDFVPQAWMRRIQRYNRMKILPALYEKYSQFEFMLTYELDAFVFSDQLQTWCESEWDYVGAPWFVEPPTRPLTYLGVGNSGFSLRKIQQCIRVMNQFGWLTNPVKSV
ncbi:MAG: DUF5672 family protein, partial [Planctomycetota bacterium]